MIRAVAAGTVTLVCSIALTVVSAWLITRAWQMPPILDLSIAVTAVRALGISRAVFRYFDRLAAHDVAFRRATASRRTAYRNSPVTGLSRAGLLRRMGQDIDDRINYVVQAVVPANVAVVTSILAVAFTLLLSPVAAGVLALGLLLSAASCLLVKPVEVPDHAGDIDRVLAQSVQLRVDGKLEEALAEVDRSSAAIAAAHHQLASRSAWTQGLVTAIAALTVVAVMWSAGYFAGEHSPEWYVVLALLPTAAFEAVANLPGAAEAKSAADLSAARAKDTPTQPLENRHGDRLVARGLVYGRTPQRPLGTIDLDLELGERKIITAPSGTGKTTLLMTLAGILPPLDGELGEFDALFFAEDQHIFATTVRDNLAVAAPGATDAQMREVLDALGFPRDIGLDEVLVHGAQSLSGGQRRRLIIARALLSDAPILLLDEPFEHIDDAAELKRVLASDDLPGARATRTLVIVEHPR